MSLSYTQNFDGVTPPAIPSGWNVDAVWTTSASQFVSSPNSISVVDNTSVYKWATYGTADSLNGASLDMSAYFYMPSSVVSSSWQFGLSYRCDNATMNNTSTRCYVARIQDNPDTDVASISLGTITNGTYSSITSVSMSSGGTSGQGWHYLNAKVSGDSHEIYLQYVADGFWMNSGGSFAAPYVPCISTTNSTYTDGDYFGLFARCPSNAISIYFDDFAVDTPYTVGSLLRVPMDGLNRYANLSGGMFG